MYLLKLPENKQITPFFVIGKWCVSQGDAVEKEQKLCEIEGFGETMEIISPLGGTVASVDVAGGQIFACSQVLATIGQPSEKSTETKVEKNEVAGNIAKESGSKMDNIIPILMPQAGQSMEEGTIISWKVKAGDTITVGQVILDIETDKATMEVEAPDAGRISKIVAQEGEIIEVKVPIAYIGDDDAAVEAYIAANSDGAPAESAPVAQAAPAAQAQQKPVGIQQAAATSDSGRVKASPAARKIAQQKGIDIAAVATGSGPGGRIISTDVENANISAVPAAAPGEVRSIPISKMRKAIAKNLTRSKQTVPHFYMKATIEADKLFSLYKETKQQFKCSLNDFITLACARLIAQYPAFRSHYKETEILEFPTANIGIAVGTDDGLTVPVLVGADRMNLQTVGTQTRSIVENARKGKMEGLGQGVFTITNLGMFGTEEFSAIINPPEAAILAVGAIVEAVIVKDGALKAGRVMTVQLSADHRIIDGLLAAQFMKDLKELLQDPQQLLT